MIALPPGAEVIRIIPNQVELKLEMTKSVELKIRASVFGKVKEGFTHRVEVIPDKVLVEGPESKIQSKDEVRTAPVDISNLAQSTVFYDVDLILPKPELRLATDVTKVRVNVVVQDIESAKASPKRK
jgi:YbbR domain-containing protein